ncbi:MAG: hypothetical protein ACTSVL_07415 [Promethearchaeota archaeon]
MFNLGEWILLISFSIIYFVFLLYDLFKRGDNYGSFAYIVALLPVNYLWFIINNSGTYSFGPVGAMMVLAACWLLALIRDIYIKDRANGYKDADDVALMLIIGGVIQVILIAVLPAIPSANIMQNGTRTILKFFYLPDFFPAGGEFAASATIILIFKILTTAIVMGIIYPTLVDLKDTSVNIVALIIITVVYAIPFLFLAYLWAPTADLIWVLTVLFSVLFFTVLLMVTRGSKQK